MRRINTDNEGDFCYLVKDGVIVRQNVVTGISSDMDGNQRRISEGDDCCDFLGYGSDGRTAGKSCDAVSKRRIYVTGLGIYQNCADEYQEQ